MNIEGVWGGVWGGVDKIEMLSDVWGWGGLGSVLDAQFLFLY